MRLGCALVGAWLAGIGSLGAAAPQATEFHGAAAAEAARQAVVGLRALPSEDRAQAAAMMAEDYRGAAPEAEAAAWRTAFEAALEIPRRPSAASLAQLKLDIERRAVSGLAQGGRTEDAIALARRADVRRSLIYDALIGAIAPVAREIALAEECQRLDGSFPYYAVSAVFSRQSGRGPEWDELMLDALAAATHEVDPIGMAEAARYFLPLLPEVRPAFRQRQQEAILSEIDTLRARVWSESDRPAAAAAAAALLHLVEGFAPTRAESLRAELPYAAGTAVPERPRPRPDRALLAAEFEPERHLGDGSAVADPVERFRILVAALAGSQNRNLRGDGGQFGLALSEAMSLAQQPDIESRCLSQIANLARIMMREGRQEDGRRLTNRALGLAQEQALDFGRRFDGLAPATRVESLAALPADGHEILDAIYIGALVDAPAAISAASGIDGILAPLALARVARAGAVPPLNSHGGCVGAGGKTYCPVF